MDPTFLNDGEGKKSSSRIGMLWGLFIGGLVVAFMAWNHALNETIFLIFLASSGGVYSVEKFASQKKNQ